MNERLLLGILFLVNGLILCGLSSIGFANGNIGGGACGATAGVVITGIGVAWLRFERS